MKKLLYYIKNFGQNALPPLYFKRKYQQLRNYENNLDDQQLEELHTRLNYYLKQKQPFDLPRGETVRVKDFKLEGKSMYYLDLKEFLHYFTGNTRFAYHFGDETHINNYPTLFKARQIGNHSSNSVLFKLVKKRHFVWVEDKTKFADKKDQLVWRGTVYPDHFREKIVKELYDHPLCDIGQTNKSQVQFGYPWQKPRMTLEEQIACKFIFCPEGHDVATNLKWAMSSNSLCVMPKLEYETWFMEGTLKAGVHYVEIKKDLSDLEKKINHYSTHQDEAQEIIKNAHQHVERFRNPMMEDLLCFKVLEKYAQFSGQRGFLRFE